MDIGTVNDEAMAKQYNVSTGHKLLKHDFVLISEEDSRTLREKRAKEALEKLGRRVKIVDGLPIPDVD